MWDSSNERPKILVVDDNPLILGVIESVLLAEKLSISTCSNGKEALTQLNSEPFDLIICDVMMPEMGGYELFENVRSNSQFYHVPFLFLTALGSEEEKAKGFSSGADEYLTKPFDPKELLAMVKGKLARSKNIKMQSQELYDKYRKNVLHTLSHEFRTPLVAINTGAELLLDRPEVEQGKVKTLVEAIQRGGARLEKLVTDFMILQQIQAGLSERLANSGMALITVEQFSENIKDRISNYARALDREVIYSSHFNKEDKIRIFQSQVEDAIERIVSNAIKFSKKPSPIEISIISLGDEIIVKIKDYGVGISENLCKEITQAFRQLNREKFEQQGSGIGLNIAISYLSFNKCIANFASESGKGTEVTVHIPLEK